VGDPEFEDIRIGGLDLEATTGPAPGTDVWDVHLRLHPAPPEVWDQIFELVWSGRRYQRWRRARISGGSLVITCDLDEIDAYHLPHLETAVAETNGRYREWRDQEAQQGDQEIQRRTDGEAALDALEDRLKDRDEES
jgi:hypothetical protein